MEILCSYCSAAKRLDEGPLPAIERYRSERLRALWRRGAASGTPLHILSGQFGLLTTASPIPWYDHLLDAREVDAMAARVAQDLRVLGVTAVRYHTASPEEAPDTAPYLAVMRAACAEAGVELTVVELEGDPE
ncbi:MAG: hypothetical protein IPK64_17825 [bacterium]|nr:hypothetical protein [bacterium]